MPLTSLIRKRVDLNDDGSEWVEMRAPSFDMIMAATRAHPDDPGAMAAATARQCVVAWSFDEELTPERLGDLDFQSWVKIMQASTEMMPGSAEAAEAAEAPKLLRRTGKRFHALAAALEGEGPPPDAWMISQICQAFGCTPVEALAQPMTLTLQVLEARRFAEAWRAINDAESDDDVPDTPMVKLAGEVLAHRVRERLAARKAATRKA